MTLDEAVAELGHAVSHLELVSALPESTAAERWAAHRRVYAAVRDVALAAWGTAAVKDVQTALARLLPREGEEG